MASRRELIETQLLLLQCRRGKPAAMERLVKLWERPLYYYVRRLMDTAEEARDVAQDTWFCVIQSFRSVRDPAAFPAWLFKVARNNAANHFRKTRLLEPLPEDGSAAEIPAGNEADSVLASNAEELHWGLSRLNPAHSECLILHFLEGFSIDEVADITGVAAGTVKSRLHYAKKALRAVLEKEAERNEQQQSQR
jgi:RNA polymerase sigma-70 factor (ECF subfamily)